MELAENNTYLDLVESCIKDDLTNFIRLVENGGCNMDEEIPWLTCPIGCKIPKVLMRTPLMIAAISRSENVVEYIVRSGLVNVDKPSPSDGATAIECAYDVTSSSRIIMMLRSARCRRGQLNSMINAPSMHQLGPGMAEVSVERLSVNYNRSQCMTGKQEPHTLMNISSPAIMNYNGHARGSALDAGPSSSHQQQHFKFIQSMQGRQEPNIRTSSYATINNYGHTGGVAAGERPSSSNHQVYQNMQEPEVMINSSTPGPEIMNKYEHTQGKAAAVADDWPSLMEDVLLEVRKLLNSTQE